MKLVVCTNFAQPFHTGGAERVVQQITETLSKEESFLCTVFSQYGSHPVFHNGVKVVPIGNLSEEQFIDHLIKEDADHLFIYSDWFFMWPAILANLHRLKMPKSIGLVGMNRMRSEVPANKFVAEMFIKNSHEFKVLAHAENYVDAMTCRKLGIPVSIIHNAIDLQEFVPSSFEFKKHYGIKTEKMLLCVSNFFPGKGQEFLPPIIGRLAAKHKNFTFVFISSTLAFQPGNRMRAMIKSNCEKMGLPVRFLNDIPREHVVQSYFESDVFVFPSQQECGPIVVLEAMAAKKPWIAMNVGHIGQLDGGICVESTPISGELLRFDGNIHSMFFTNIEKLLNNNHLCFLLGEKGRDDVVNNYNWTTISKEYARFFRGEVNG